jgi:hypothetical protein
MAELTITPAQVLSGQDADFYQGISGDTVTAGKTVYLDSLSNRLRLADANGSLDAAEVIGIALHEAAPEQPLRVQTRGTLTLGLGAAVTTSTVYIVGATPGGIAPVVDKAPGWYCSLVGVGNAQAGIYLNLFPSHTVA